jgi:hypothetical protein
MGGNIGALAAACRHWGIGMLEGEGPNNQHEVEGGPGETIVIGLGGGYFFFKLSNFQSLEIIFRVRLGCRVPKGTI